MSSHGVESRAVSWSGVGSGRVGCVSGQVGSGQVESRGVELSGAEWSRFKLSRVESWRGVECSRVDSRF